MADGLNHAYQQQAGRTINLADFGAERFTGSPPPIEYLVENSIPLGVVALLASMGGVGKSFTAMQLCLAVTTPPPAPKGNLDFNNVRPILGGRVMAHGSAVFITSEDSEAAIHRRLAVVDPFDRRLSHPGKLKVVALPDAGGPLPLFVSTREGVQTTPEWDMICDQLASIADLKLLVFDPLSTFAQVDLDADNCAVGFVAGKFGSLAAATGATVMVTHHMRKHKQTETPKVPAQARELIRGASNIVDGVRCAYALWMPDDKDGKDICNRLRIPYWHGRVVMGGIVKTNDKADLSIAEYVRTDDGLLLDRTADIRATRAPADTLRSELVATIAMHAEIGHPFTVTGATGLFEQKEKLPPSLQAVSRDRLRAMAEELLVEGAIKRCMAGGSTVDKWLDVPGGQFGLGIGRFAHGAAMAAE
jgi:AAA domain